MSGRKTVFANDEYYHIFNRGIARQPTFLNKRDYERFLLSLNYYRFDNLPVRLSRFLDFPQEQKQIMLDEINKNSSKIIEIYCYSFMPNHYHLLIKQIKDYGITIFMKKMTNSYTRFFNIRHERVGDLFQGVFKAVHVETDEQLLHLSRYIHLNPLMSHIVSNKNFLDFPWSSFNDYLKNKSLIVNTSQIIELIGSPGKYKKFVLDQVNYANQLEEIKHLTLE